MKLAPRGYRLLVLLGVVAVLAWVVGPRSRTGPQVQLDREATAKAVHEIRAAIDAYSADCGAPPVLTEGLAFLMTNVAAKGWRGPYLRDRLGRHQVVNRARCRTCAS